MRFASLVGIPVGIASSAVRIKICAITVVIKKYKSIINKNKKKHGKIVSLVKTKLNSVDVLISETSIKSYISHDEFIKVNNVLKEYDDMREEIKNSNK